MHLEENFSKLFYLIHFNINENNNICSMVHRENCHFSKLFYLIHLNINENNLGKYAVCCKGKNAILVINEGMQKYRVLDQLENYKSGNGIHFKLCYLLF